MRREKDDITYYGTRRQILEHINLDKIDEARYNGDTGSVNWDDDDSYSSSAYFGTKVKPVIKNNPKRLFPRTDDAGMLKHTHKINAETGEATPKYPDVPNWRGPDAHDKHVDFEVENPDVETPHYDPETGEGLKRSDTFNVHRSKYDVNEIVPTPYEDELDDFMDMLSGESDTPLFERGNELVFNIFDSKEFNGKAIGTTIIHFQDIKNFVEGLDGDGEPNYLLPEMYRKILCVPTEQDIEKIKENHKIDVYDLATGRKRILNLDHVVGDVLPVSLTGEVVDGKGRTWVPSEDSPFWTPVARTGGAKTDMSKYSRYRYSLPGAVKGGNVSIAPSASLDM